MIHIEDFDESVDKDFIKESFTPYLKDLYKDLLMRSNQSEHLDKVTFIEYTKLPGIINDRLHFMFSNKEGNVHGTSPKGPSVNDPKRQETKSGKKRDEFVTE